MSVTIAGLNKYGRYGYALITDVEVTTAPLVSAVSSELVKEYLRIDSDDTSQDAVINTLIESGITDVESYVNASMIEQVRRVTFANGDLIKLPYAPIISIDAVEEQDAEGVWTATTDYTNYGNGDLRFGSPGIYRVTYTAGFGESPSDVPTNLTNAVIRYVSEHFEMRQGFSLLQGSARIDGLSWQEVAQPKKKYAL